MIIYWPDASLLFLLASFLFTFLFARHITARIRAGHGRFADVVIGTMHLHHMVWGVGLVLLWGTVAIAFRPGWPLSIAPAVGFGIGAALLLDEFALLLYLRDVYWSKEGRHSVYAVIVMVLVVGIIALQIGPTTLPFSRPVVIAIVTAYILLTAVSLAKGKLFTCLIGIFLPAVVLIGALRLARPESPWARLRYGRDSKKMRRALARYRPDAPWERGRQHLLEFVGRTTGLDLYADRVAELQTLQPREALTRMNGARMRSDIIPPNPFPYHERRDHTGT
jgi:hypothetical protein